MVRFEFASCGKPEHGADALIFFPPKSNASRENPVAGPPVFVRAIAKLYLPAWVEDVA